MRSLKKVNKVDSRGIRQGYWEHYYLNGQLRSKGSYVDGKREGYWGFYYDDGVLESKGRYVDGKRYGCWEWYWTNGELWRIYRW